MPALAAIAVRSPGMRMLSEHGGEKILIYHQVHDRAVSNVFRHCVSGFWASHAGTCAANKGTHAKEMSHLLTWHTSVGCGVHDAHNALRWGHQTALGKNEHVLKAVYIATSALKSSSFGCVLAIGPWLLEVTRERTVDQLPTERELQELYTFLGLPVHVVEVLVDFRCVYSQAEGVYMVASGKRGEQNWLAELSGALLSTFSFTLFTESRWLTVGASCRAVLSAWSLGYFGLLAYMSKRGLVNSYLQAGFEKLDEESMRFILVVAMSSYMPESVQALILKDARLARQYDDLCEDMDAEVEHVESLGAFTWQHVGMLVSEPPSTVRNYVVKAVMAEYAYIHMRVLDVLEKPPFSYCQLPPLAILHLLRGWKEAPDETVSNKWWHLVKMGYNSEQLLKGLDLFSRVSFSTQFTERQHASSATMHKYHPESGLRTLRERAFLHTLRPLLPDVSHHDRDGAREHRLRQQLSRMERRRTNYITGRQMFFKEKAEHERHCAHGEAGTPRSMKELMFQHGEQWVALEPDAKQAYENRAVQYRSQLETALQEEKASLEESVQIEIARRENQTYPSPKSMVASAAKLADSDVQKWSQLCGAQQFSDAALRERRKQANTCPEPLQESCMQEYYNKSLLQERERSSCTSIYTAVARNRAFLSDAAFCVPQDSGGVEWYRLVLAVQNPCMLSFLPLDEQLVPAIPDDDVFYSAVGEGRTTQNFSFFWQYTAGHFETRDIFDVTDTELLGVVLQTTFKARGFLTSFGTLENLEGILAGLACEHSKERPPKKQKRKAASSSTHHPEGVASLAASVLDSMHASSSVTKEPPATEDIEVGEATFHVENSRRE
eukprot:6455422-Amphidinium_carterae.8